MSDSELVSHVKRWAAILADSSKTTSDKLEIIQTDFEVILGEDYSSD